MHRGISEFCARFCIEAGKLLIVMLSDKLNKKRNYSEKEFLGYLERNEKRQPGFIKNYIESHK